MPPAMSTRSHEGQFTCPDLAAILARVTGRGRSLFQDDIDSHDADIRARVTGKRILVTGAAGSIGAATVNQLFRYRPVLLAAIDLSENNLVELVRDIRSRADLEVGDALQTYVVDFGSRLGGQFIEEVGPFDLILHFAAMKHVRSERDVFSLSRLIETNVLNVDRFLTAVKRFSPGEVFAISSDKACRPANLMGASKRLMETMVFWHADHAGSVLKGGQAPALPRVACTRFANVAFSDGSLLAGYFNRIRKRQPLAGPNDVRRYFITEEEAGQLCLMTAALAENKQIFVPRLDPSAHLRGFDEIAQIVLEAHGYAPRWYKSDEEARQAIQRDLKEGDYPCCFTTSDTSGEKGVEEFAGPNERLTSSTFRALDVIDESPVVDSAVLQEVLVALADEISHLNTKTGKRRLLELVARAVPSLQHLETGRNLDQKM